MKKKLIAVIVCVAMLSATLCGCASSSATSATTTAPAEPVITVEKEEPEVTEPVEEKEPEVAEEPEKVEESTEEVAEAETSDASDTTEVTEEATQEEPEEEVSEATKLFNEYIADGDFKEAEQYGKDLGASDIYVMPEIICYSFGDWFVQVSGGEQDMEMAYAAIGEWNGKNDCTFSYLFDFGEGVEVINGTQYSKQALALIPVMIDYMKANPDPNTKPSLDGDWQACEPNNPWRD